ncbi:MAG: hypothetical protein FIA97_02110 [Methylococcaceae bacterium]|nr:hypothetical protein [Methylococcaceae bacterium]
MDEPIDRVRRALMRCLLLLVLPAAALADWSNFNRYHAIAELRIDDGGIAVDLRLTESGWSKLIAARTPEVSEGEAVAGLVVVGVPSGGRPTASPPATQHVAVGAEGNDGAAYYQAQWTLALPADAKTLQLRAGDGLAKDDLGLIVLHRGVPVSDLIALDKPLTLTLDQTDPWSSHFDDPALIRRHAEPRSYVYVEPYEVRHEVLIRLADLIGAIEPSGRNPSRIPAGQRPELKRKIGEFLLGKNPVTIDGEGLKPLLDRVEFVQFSRSGMLPVDEAQDLDVATALVGAVIVYLTGQPAQSLAVRWELLGPQTASRAVSVILGKESFDGYLTRTEPIFSWSREDALDPIPATETSDSAAVAAITELTGEKLAAMLQSLLHNAYRAFQLRDEEAVYDRLAKSLADPLLEDIYLQQRRSQLQQAKGLGGEGRVERIELLEAKRVDRARRDWTSILSGATGDAQREVEVEARWKALGEVSHWGHGHPRENLYAARLTLHRDAANGWKIAALHFLDGQRLGPVARR